MAEKQESLGKPNSQSEEEKKIPVFTVLKNGAILKNIFLLDNPPATHVAITANQEFEEILVVGRHPDCNIVLEHPSISRFHLRIHSNPSSHSLSVIDLSSVHGSWISGNKIEPGVRVELKEGDKMKLGGSRREYMLHWIPISRAYDLENPFVAPLGEAEPFKEMDEKEHQVSCSSSIHLYVFNYFVPLVSNLSYIFSRMRMALLFRMRVMIWCRIKIHHFLVRVCCHTLNVQLRQLLQCLRR
uniref:Parallel spindle 1 n=1 Tax=Solanum tuberosum TaxID=4113 RepID=M1CGU0_SOLTU